MSVFPITFPPKKLSQSILSTDSSFIISNILHWDGVTNLAPSLLGTVAYAIFTNDTRTALEIMQIDPSTIANASITIVARGLDYSGGATSATARKFDWTANETTIQLGTDFPQLFQYYKDYIDQIAIAGAPNATTSIQGLVELATQAEYDAGTATGGTTASLVATPAVLRGKKYNDYAADAGSNDAYAITITPAITAYTEGQVFTFKANTANTGAATLNVSGLGAKTIKKDVSSDLDTGDILANQIVMVQYDGTNMQLLSKSSPNSSGVPVIRTYTTVSTAIGDSSTQFDITNPAGTTFRYTYDGTGTDPGISLANNPIGSLINFQSGNFNSANNGIFVVTGAGTNYVEITNASGVAESNKTIGSNSYITKSGTSGWTKPAGLKYVVVEVIGGGGQGGPTSTPGFGNTNAAGGGGSGAYSKKLFAAGSLNATEYYLVGYGGTGNGRESSFGTSIKSTGGTIGGGNGGGNGGTATGGDINIPGQSGADSVNSSDAVVQSGAGASSILGIGGLSTSGAVGSPKNGVGYGAGGSGAVTTYPGSGSQGGNGTQGIVIITEYYA